MGKFKRHLPYPVKGKVNAETRKIEYDVQASGLDDYNRPFRIRADCSGTLSADGRCLLNGQYSNMNLITGVSTQEGFQGSLAGLRPLQDKSFLSDKDGEWHIDSQEGPEAAANVAEQKKERV